MRLFLALLFMASLVFALAGVLWLIQATTLPHQVIAGALIAASLLITAITGATALIEDLLRDIRDRLPRA